MDDETREWAEQTIETFTAWLQGQIDSGGASRLLHALGNEDADAGDVVTHLAEAFRGEED